MKTKTRKDKRAYIIIALVVALLLLAVGYAAFSKTLTISGTVAGTVPTYNVHFTNAAAGTSINVAGDTLTANVDFDYPGDAKSITATIKNDSTRAVKLTGFTLTNPSDNKVTLTATSLATDGTETLAAGASCTYTFVLSWAADATSNASDSYSIQFDYEQVDQTVTGLTASHSHN